MVIKLKDLCIFISIICFITGMFISARHYNASQNIWIKPYQNTESYIYQAKQYFHTDVNIPAAMDEYEKVLALEPDNIQALIGLAEVLECTASSLEMRSKTKEILYKILKLDPYNEQAYISLLNLLISGSEQENLEAENLFRTAPASFLKQPDFVQLKATFLLKQDKTAEALKLLEQALNQHPENIQLLYAIAYACYLQDNFKSAKTYITHAKKLAVDADNPFPVEIHSLHDLIEKALSTGYRQNEYYY